MRRGPRVAVASAAMPRHTPPRPRRSRSRAIRGVLCVLLPAVALALPALALASKKSPNKAASVPSCAHFSRAKMARLIHVASLEFEGKSPGANICTYKTPRVPGHYAALLQLTLAPTSKAVFAKAKQRAEKEAAARGALFRSHGPALFYVAQVYPSEAKGPVNLKTRFPNSARQAATAIHRGRRTASTHTDP